MGLGIWRKIKEGAKKLFKWGKEKLFPIIKTAWKTVVKQLMMQNPKTAPIVPMLTPFLGSGGTTTVKPAIQTGLDAVKNTISPFIKLKKNSSSNQTPSGYSSAPAMEEPAAAADYGDVAI